MKKYISVLLASIFCFCSLLFAFFERPAKATAGEDFISIYTVVFHPGQNLQDGSVYNWDFNNDGVIDFTGVDGSYVFSGPGTYSVKLTKTNLDGSSVSTLKTIIIGESIVPPTPPAPPVPSNWLDAAWKGRTKITIAAGKVSSDLVDFPVYVNLADLGTASSFWTKAKADCSDIRITKADGKTELPREVVACDLNAKTGELHFKVSGTLATASANDFYIYYGNTTAVDYAASDALGRENVWNANYKGVWHFQENTQIYKDSTVNHLDGNGINGLSRVGTNIGYGASCDGLYDYIDLGNKINLNNNFTISTVFKSVDFGNLPGTLVAWGYNNGAKTRRLLDIKHTNQKLSFDTNWTPVQSTSTVISNKFSYGAVSMDGASSTANINIYLDAEKTYGMIDYSSFSSSETRICANGGSGEAKFNGIITEVRISSIQRNEAWNKAEYANLINAVSFYQVSVEELI